MQTYDILMLSIAVAATVFGAIKGFAWQLASIASIGLSYFVAYKFRGALAQSIQTEAPWNQFLAMLILFVATSLMVWVVFRMATAWIDRLQLHEFDSHMGAVFGLIKGGLYCVLATLFAVTLAGDSVRTMVVTSRSGGLISDLIAKSESVVPPEVHDFILAHTPSTLQPSTDGEALRLPTPNQANHFDQRYADQFSDPPLNQTPNQTSPAAWSGAGSAAGAEIAAGVQTWNKPETRR